MPTHKILRDFVSAEKRTHSFKIGETVASALAGFVAGVIVASMIWMLAIYYFSYLESL